MVKYFINLFKLILKENDLVACHNYFSAGKYGFGNQKISILCKNRVCRRDLQADGVVGD